MARFYAECDGRVFLVQKAGRWTLAASTAEFPFSVREKFRVRILGEDVVHSDADLQTTPDAGGNWWWKDEAVHRDDVDEVTRQAMYRTMPRAVSKLAIVRGPAGQREVLLHVTKVGFWIGNWSLTGGYLSYGESPEQAAGREAKEEMGIEAKVHDLLAMDAALYDENGNWFITFCYLGSTDATTFRPKEDEVGEIRWFPLKEAVSLVKSRIDRKGLVALVAREGGA